MPPQGQLAASGQAVDGVEDLIPAIVGQKNDERIQADHSLFFTVPPTYSSGITDGLTLG